MRRFEIAFEVGERLHEFSGGLARSGINLRMTAQAPCEVCEKALNRAYGNQREMYTIMPDAAGEVAYFVAQKFGKIDMFCDEYNSFNGAI